MSLKQKADGPIIKFLHCLKVTSRYWKFERLGKDEMYIEELIQLRLNDDIDNTSHRYRMLEQLQQ